MASITTFKWFSFKCRWNHIITLPRKDRGLWAIHMTYSSIQDINLNVKMYKKVSNQFRLSTCFQCKGPERGRGLTVANCSSAQEGHMPFSEGLHHWEASPWPPLITAPNSQIQTCVASVKCFFYVTLFNFQIHVLYRERRKNKYKRRFLLKLTLYCSIKLINLSGGKEV